jgi:hypothetical protein
MRGSQLTGVLVTKRQASLDDPGRESRRSDRQPVRKDELMVVGRNDGRSLKVWERLARYDAKPRFRLRHRRGGGCRRDRPPPTPRSADVALAAIDDMENDQRSQRSAARLYEYG